MAHHKARKEAKQYKKCPETQRERDGWSSHSIVRTMWAATRAKQKKKNRNNRNLCRRKHNCLNKYTQNEHIEAAMWARVVRFNLLYTFIRRCCFSLFDITFFVIFLPFSRALSYVRQAFDKFFFLFLFVCVLSIWNWNGIFFFRVCVMALLLIRLIRLHVVWQKHREVQANLERVPFVMACVETSTSRCKRTEDC